MAISDKFTYESHETYIYVYIRTLFLKKIIEKRIYRCYFNIRILNSFY